MISFTIPGEPVAKGRPRFTKSGHTYTPKKTASYENLVRLMYAEKYKGLSFRDDAQLICVIKAYMGVPKSKPNRCDKYFSDNPRLEVTIEET